MATAGELITAAFNKVSVYNPTPEQTATALISLNNFFGTLSADGMGYAVTGENFTLTVGKATYTIGASGDFDTTRPDSLDSCFIRNSDGYDFPIDTRFSGVDYNRLSMKTLEVRPERAYFLPEYPLAKIIFDHEPDEAYTAYFDFWKPFTAFASTSTETNLPGQYNEFVIYNLAISLGEDWDRQISDTVLRRARETKDIVETLNVANRIVPRSRFDSMLVGRRYNIYTDE